MLLVDLRESLTDDLVQLTLVEVTGGQVAVTFAARQLTSWDDNDNGERVVLQSRVNIDDGAWHRIDIVRYRSFVSILCVSLS